MRVSTRGEYGIRALLELSRRFGEGYVQSRLIASARSVPESYLYQLLVSLRKSGLVRSRRGPQGGHMLTRPPASISLAEALTALEGPLVPTACAEEGASDDCAMMDRCVVRAVWRRVNDSVLTILRETTFGELARQEAALATSPIAH